MGFSTTVGQVINVQRIGVQEGSGLSATIRGNNAQRLAKYATAGYSLTFPSGVYEINNVIAWSGTDNVSVTGPGAHIVQYGDGVKTLSFTSCDNVLVDGLKITGPYRASRSGVTGGYSGGDEALIWTNQCDDVRIVNNVCRGSCTHTVGVNNVQGATISGNQFYDGAWDSGAANSTDIFLGSSKIKEVTIANNQCCSNTLVGIMCLNPNNNTVVANNTVIAMDASRAELTTAAATLRKAGIEMQYETSAHDPLSSEYEFVIEGNKVSNCRWSGISLQNNDQTAGGFRGAITGNVIRNICLETGTPSGYLMAGILVRGYREAAITGNVVTKVNDMPSVASKGAGIQLRLDVEATDGRVSVATVTGNIISDVTGKALRFHELTGDVICTSNIVTDFDQAIEMFTNGSPTRMGNMTFTGNRFVSDRQVDQSQLNFNITTTTDLTFALNHVELTGTFTSSYYALLVASPNCRIIGNRFLANATVGNQRALRCTGTTARHTELIVSDNSFENWNIGFFTEGSAVTIGPVLHTNCEFINCTTPTANSQVNIVIPGRRFANNVNKQNVEVFHTDTPVTSGGGNWLAGDRVIHNGASSGQPMGWVCTIAGNPGTWIPMANMP